VSAEKKKRNKFMYGDDDDLEEELAAAGLSPSPRKQAASSPSPAAAVEVKAEVKDPKPSEPKLSGAEDADREVTAAPRTVKPVSGMGFASDWSGSASAGTVTISSDKKKRNTKMFGDDEDLEEELAAAGLSPTKPAVTAAVEAKVSNDTAFNLASGDAIASKATRHGSEEAETAVVSTSSNRAARQNRLSQRAEVVEDAQVVEDEEDPPSKKKDSTDATLGFGVKGTGSRRREREREKAKLSGSEYAAREEATKSSNNKASRGGAGFDSDWSAGASTGVASAKSDAELAAEAEADEKAAAQARDTSLKDAEQLAVRRIRRQEQKKKREAELAAELAEEDTEVAASGTVALGGTDAADALLGHKPGGAAEVAKPQPTFGKQNTPLARKREKQRKQSSGTEYAAREEVAKAGSDAASPDGTVEAAEGEGGLDGTSAADALLGHKPGGNAGKEAAEFKGYEELEGKKKSALRRNRDARKMGLSSARKLSGAEVAAREAEAKVKPSGPSRAKMDSDWSAGGGDGADASADAGVDEVAEGAAAAEGEGDGGLDGTSAADALLGHKPATAKAKEENKSTFSAHETGRAKSPLQRNREARKLGLPSGRRTKTFSGAEVAAHEEEAKQKSSGSGLAVDSDWSKVGGDAASPDGTVEADATVEAVAIVEVSNGDSGYDGTSAADALLGHKPGGKDAAIAKPAGGNPRERGNLQPLGGGRISPLRRAREKEAKRAAAAASAEAAQQVEVSAEVETSVNVIQLDSDVDLTTPTPKETEVARAEVQATNKSVPAGSHVNPEMEMEPEVGMPEMEMEPKVACVIAEVQAPVVPAVKVAPVAAPAPPEKTQPPQTPRQLEKPTAPSKVVTSPPAKPPAPAPAPATTEKSGPEAYKAYAQASEAGGRSAHTRSGHPTQPREVRLQEGRAIHTRSNPAAATVPPVNIQQASTKATPASPPTSRVADTPRKSVLKFNNITGKYQYANDGEPYCSPRPGPDSCRALLTARELSDATFSPRLDEFATRNVVNRPSNVAALPLHQVSPSAGALSTRQSPAQAQSSARHSPGFMSNQIQQQAVMSPRLDSPKLDVLQSEIEMLKRRQVDQLAQARLRAFQTQEQISSPRPRTARSPSPRREAPRTVSSLVSQAYLNHGAGHRAIHVTTPRDSPRAFRG